MQGANPCPQLIALNKKKGNMANKRIWTTKDEDDLKISKMETSHIKNCINMIERNAEKGREIEISLGYSPDSDYPEYDLIFIQGKEVLNYYEPKYTYLKEELKKRKEKNDR